MVLILVTAVAEVTCVVVTFAWVLMGAVAEDLCCC